MALENEHLDLLQNIEFAIVSVYRKHLDMSDYDVMRVLDALIGYYRAEFRNHTQKPIVLEDPEMQMFADVKAICEWRMGRANPIEDFPQIPESKKSLDDVRGCLMKIRKSVDKWNKRGGPKGYLEFVSEYV